MTVDQPMNTRLNHRQRKQAPPAVVLWCAGVLCVVSGQYRENDRRQRNQPDHHDEHVRYWGGFFADCTHGERGNYNDRGEVRRCN